MVSGHKPLAPNQGNLLIWPHSVVTPYQDPPKTASIDTLRWSTCSETKVACKRMVSLQKRPHQEHRCSGLLTEMRHGYEAFPLVSWKWFFELNCAVVFCADPTYGSQKLHKGVTTLPVWSAAKANPFIQRQYTQHACLLCRRGVAVDTHGSQKSHNNKWPLTWR